MKQLIFLIAVTAMSALQIIAQTVMIDEVDWSTQTPGATSGTSINNTTLWNASGADQDGSGTFGVSGNVFTFEDTEGSLACPCIVADPSPECGNNDNILSVGPFLLQSYCEVSITFDIAAVGPLSCGAANDQSPADFISAQCPSDNGNQWLATDGLEVKIINSENNEERITNICGSLSETGIFRFSETFDVGENGTAIAVFITGGTQNGGAYQIGKIKVEGIPRLNPAINLQIITEHDNNVVCVGEEIIIVETGANPLSQFTWAFPDGSTISGNVNNGRDKLTLNNIDPSMSGTYRVTVADGNNCELYDDIDITILPSNDVFCQSQLSFSLFPVLCSTDTLPSADNNGITGVWTPGDVLAPFAGQTRDFTFTPDDPLINPEVRLITVNDLSNFENFASAPLEIPILCNAGDTTYDFIELFSLNYVEHNLTVSGDLSLFDFITNVSSINVASFIDEFRNIDVKGISPRTVGFVIDATNDCGAGPISKSFFVTIIDPVAPIIIDETLCAGDFIAFGNHKIFRDTVIAGEDDCDTMLIATINVLQPSVSTLIFNSSAACGQAYFYYDTIIGGQYIGFVKSELTDPPPYGSGYDTVFRESTSADYLLPIPAANGCDSIQRMSITIGQSNIETVEFDLCSNLDTTIRVGSQLFEFNQETPYRFLTVGPCTFLEVTANIMPAIADSLPAATYCASEVIPVEVSPGNFMDFDASLTYPYTVFLEEGANGCAATFVVDFTFVEPTRDTITRRICPGESFLVGSVSFDQAVTNQDVLLSGGAASTCDSIVTVNVTMIEAVTIPITQTICPEGNYIFEGETFDANRVSDLVRTLSVQGCDSIIYDVNIDFFQVVDITINPVLCPGEVLELSEYRYTIDADNLTADLMAITPDGCNQNVFIRATMTSPIETVIADTICAGEIYTFDGQDITTTGSYSVTQMSLSTQCDSTTTLNLFVREPIDITDDGEIIGCTGTPVTHIGMTYDTPGSYSETLTSIKGCDSVVTFTVSFDPIPTVDVGVLHACPNEPLIYENEQYTQAGNYEDTLTTVAGCDSIVTFEVVLDTIPVISEKTCNGSPFSIGGQEYNATGTYTVSFPEITVNGCDSTIILDLIVEESIQVDLGIREICTGGSIMIGGRVLDQEQTYTITLTSVDNCDSIVTVTIDMVDEINVDLGQVILCQGDTYDFAGQTISTTGIYRDTMAAATFCDSITKINIEVIPELVITIDNLIGSCEGEANGAFELESIPFATPPFVVTGLPGISNVNSLPLSVTDLAEGDYDFDIRDANGCVTSASVTIAGPTDPVVIDTSMCSGDFIPFENFRIFGDTIITNENGCDTMLILTVNRLQSSSTAGFFNSSIPCGAAFYYYDTIIGGQHIGFVKGELTDPPPYGSGYDTVFRESTNQPYTLPIPAQNGCDSIQKMLLTIGASTVQSIEFDLCSNRDTLVEVGAQTFLINSTIPYRFLPLASCSFVEITAHIMPAIADTLPSETYCASEIISVEVSRGMFMDFDASMTYPNTIFLNAGANGCPATFTVDFTFIEPTRDVITRRICPGETFDVGSVTFDQAVTDQEVFLSGQAASGCDSIVTVNVIMVEPETLTVNETICPEGVFMFEGEVFDANRSSDLVTIPSVLGCDSLIYNVNIDFIEVFDITLVPDLCPGEEMFLSEYNFTIDADNLTADLITITADGCEQNVIIRATMDAPIETGFTETICAGEVYNFDGIDRSTTGFYSVTNPSMSSGCDSISTLNLIVLAPIPITDDGEITECTGTSVVYLNNTYSEAGTYTKTLTSVAGCDSVVTFTVAFDPIPSTDVGIMKSCPDQPMTFMQKVYDAEGIYQDTMQTMAGCDSIIIFEIEFYETYNTDIGILTTCPQVPVTFYNETYDTEGSYTVTLSSVNDCDSLVTFEVVFEELDEVLVEATICSGEQFMVFNNQYTQSVDMNIVDPGGSQIGCDSTIHLILTVLEKIEIGESYDICEGSSVTVGDRTFTTSVIDEPVIFTDAQCDSTVLVTVNVLTNEASDLGDILICGTVGYDIGDTTLVDQGPHRIVLATNTGCDSIVTLNLIRENFQTDMGLRQICNGGSLQVGPNIMTDPGDYTFTFKTDAGCDSIVTVTLEVVDMIEVDLGTVSICEGESFLFGDLNITESGIYSDTEPSILGCDSITTINIEVTPSLEISINDLIGSCEGGANGSFVIGSIPFATPPFSVSGLEGITQIDQLPFTVTGLAAGTYSFDITDADGCTTFADVTITDDRDNALTITSIEIDPKGIYELILEYSGDIETIEWEDIPGLSCYDCPNPSVDITETTTFRVRVVDIEGCVSIAEITLTVDAIGNVYFPNVINPNSAHGNHRFFPQTESNTDDAHYDIFVFDRWGNMVYEMLDGPVNDISFGWNGRYQDNRINAGVYVYSVRIYKTNGISETYKGDLTVIE